MNFVLLEDSTGESAGGLRPRSADGCTDGSRGLLKTPEVGGYLLSITFFSRDF